MTSSAGSFARILLIVMMAFLGAVPVLAQQAAPPADTDRSIGLGPARSSGPEVVAEQREKIAAIGRRADQLRARVEANAEDDAILVEIRNTLEELARELIATGVAFRPRLSAINERLDEIGPPPADDAPTEPPALTLERQTLSGEKAEINTLLGEAEALSLRINRMIEEIVELRRNLFTNTLSRRYNVSEALSPEVLRDFAIENQKLYAAVSSWLRFVFSFKLDAILLATFYALLAAGLLMIGGRRVFGRLLFADPAAENPSYLNRLSVAFWSTLLPSAAVAVFLAATFFFYSYYNVLRHDIAQMMSTLFNVIATFFFVYRLSRAVFSPGKPNWRLVPVESGAARWLFALTCLTAFVTGLDFFTSRVNEALASPLTLTVAKSLLLTIVVGLLVIAIAMLRPYQTDDGKARPWHPLFRGGLVVIGVGTIVAALLGYIGLARFISQQIVVTGAILATMYIGYLSATAVSELGAFTRTTLGRQLDKRFHFDETTEDQLGLVFGIFINVLVVAIGVPLILLQWGFQWGDISSWVYNIATEVRVGSISISLIGILTGLMVFLIGYFGTRGFQRWLDGKVMARGKLDAGVRNSIGTAVGYAGIALAALVSVSAAGIDLSNLALVAGALSLGIGFGLQNIVNNFVSGLILLAERPFKVGDWIVASGIEGNVRRISVRATEIDTFQRQTVIMPNSLLINASVGNWTHRNRLGRVDIPVGVAYDSDARQVQQILYEIIAENPQALKNPAPMVTFDDFGDSALNFTIRVFVPDIASTLDFRNELRFRIVERFKEAGIDIPFPQRDITIKTMSDVLLAPEPTEKPAAPTRRTRTKPKA